MNPAPGFMEAFLHVVKTVDFNGRARRAEYWKFIAIWMCIYLPLYFLTMYAKTQPDSSLALVVSVITLLVCLALFVQSLSLVVRRLHDTDRSGWYFLFILIPFIGSIILLVWLLQDSTPGDNKYGPSPKYSGEKSPSNELV